MILNIQVTWIMLLTATTTLNLKLIHRSSRTKPTPTLLACLVNLHLMIKMILLVMDQRVTAAQLGRAQLQQLVKTSIKTSTVSLGGEMRRWKEQRFWRGKVWIRFAGRLLSWSLRTRLDLMALLEPKILTSKSRMLDRPSLTCGLATRGPILTQWSRRQLR